MNAALDSKIPDGPMADKWESFKANEKLVNPANKRKFKILVVGTGGRSHYGFDSPEPNSEVRNGNTYGVIKLTLNANGTTSGQFVVPGEATASLNGNWTLDGTTVRLSHSADTFLRDTDFQLLGTALVGELGGVGQAGDTALELSQAAHRSSWRRTPGGRRRTPDEVVGIEFAHTATLRSRFSRGNNHVAAEWRCPHHPRQRAS
jgi:hypothetical protein